MSRVRSNPSRAPSKEIVLATKKKLGAAITLATALLAAGGLLTGYLHIQPAVGLAVAGIVIGAGVARGAFSARPDAARKH